MRRFVVPLLLALVIQSMTVPAAVAGTTKGAAPVTPEPQQTVTRRDGFHLGRTVGLVHGPTTDPDAERVVRETLKQAGVRTVRRSAGRRDDLAGWERGGAGGAGRGAGRRVAG